MPQVASTGNDAHMHEDERVDTFTERARNVLRLAQEEAQRFQHNSIGTEHLLLGLVREGEGVAGKVLSSLGVDLEKVRRAVEDSVGRGDQIVSGEIGLTPGVKKVIELAEVEARRFDRHAIGTEHLLLGLVREGEGGAAQVLRNLGVKLNKVRSSVEFIVGRGDRIVLGEIGLTPRAKQVIELAEDEACGLNHHAIGPEHLLLGLVREGEGIAAGVLESLGVNLEQVRTQTLQVLNKEST